MPGAPAAPVVFVAGPIAWNLLVRVPELPRAEPHTVAARSHRQTLGGTSAGKTLNLARLGAAVTLRTLVGDDREAQWAMAELRTAGATVIAEIDPTGRTEQHVNLMSDDGRRVSIHLTTPRLTEVLHRAQTWAALTAADAVVVDLSEGARPLLAEAAAVGVPIWVDLHDYDGLDPFHREFIDHATHLFLSDDRMPDPEPFMRDRIAAGARLVVCTHGARGATAMDGDGRRYHVPAVPVAEVIDTNGAGDAFFSAALLALVGGADVESALASAAAHAARCVQSPELAPPR